MILYHNADVEDINSIVTNGLLPLNFTKNNKWEKGRANNSKNVVYLFHPISSQNSIINYGAALIMVDAEAQLSEIGEYDVNKGKYVEYTCSSVSPEKILKIFIPIFFKERTLNDPNRRLANKTLNKIEWVKVHAEVCSNNGQWIEATNDHFAKIRSHLVQYDCYFRGVDKNNKILEFRNIEYIIK